MAPLVGTFSNLEGFIEQVLPTCGEIQQAGKTFGRMVCAVNMDMDAAGRKKLLRLLDAQNTLLVESKLMSFTAGFKLAWGMAKELEADGLYSFEREEEEHICHPAEQED